MHERMWLQNWSRTSLMSITARKERSAYSRRLSRGVPDVCVATLAVFSGIRTGGTEADRANTDGEFRCAPSSSELSMIGAFLDPAQKGASEGLNFLLQCRGARGGYCRHAREVDHRR